jgi:hypothetical protein
MKQQPQQRRLRQFWGSSLQLLAMTCLILSGFGRERSAFSSLPVIWSFFVVRALSMMIGATQCSAGFFVDLFGS